MISNLGYAAFLMVEDFKLIESPSRDGDGKFVFNFDITEEKEKEMLHKYSTSKFAKFDSCLVNLKRMIPRY